MTNLPILIGSTALAAHNATANNFVATMNQHKVPDFDAILPKEELDALLKRLNDREEKHTIRHKEGSDKWHIWIDSTCLEICVTTKGSSAEFIYNYCNCGHEAGIPFEKRIVAGMTFLLAPLDVLFAIKAAHVMKPIHWKKNIEYYSFMKKLLGVSSSKEFLERYTTVQVQEIHRLGREEADARQPEKQVKMNMKNEEFFKQSEEALGGRKFEHDELHRATCYFGVPLFETLKMDKSKAIMSEMLFESLPYQQKVQTVREECYAIALERVIIPKMGAGISASASIWAEDEFKGYNYALQRICTTLTTGWFRTFAIENYDIIRVYDTPFVERFIEYVKKS